MHLLRRLLYSSSVASIVVIIVLAAALMSTAPARAEDSLGTLSIPSLNIDAPILHIPLATPTWDVSHLSMNVGHLEGTSWVDTTGNIVVVGHSLSPANAAPDVFVHLAALRPGDEIFLTVAGGRRRYVVSETRRVDVTDLSPVAPTSDDRLTLFTCALGTYSASAGDYQQRDVVVALRAD